MNDTQLNQAIQCLKSGGVIAYPTESVYGLGCDATDLESVSRILKIKKRDPDKGLILLVSDIQQASRFIIPLTEQQIAKLNQPSAHAITWLLARNRAVSTLITGTHSKLAVRVTTHPIAKMLCEGFGSPIISTSCNLHGQPSHRDAESVASDSSLDLDLIIEGSCGREPPSRIIDLLTGARIR